MVQKPNQVNDHYDQTPDSREWWSALMSDIERVMTKIYYRDNDSKNAQKLAGVLAEMATFRDHL